MTTTTTIRNTAALLLLGAGLLAAPVARAEGNVAAGQAVFEANCSLCHSPDKGVNKVGPSLWGVVGRKAGTLPGYTYSDAMAHADRVWEQPTLNVYLTNPQKTIPGVRMLFAGLPSQTDRDNVIAYLSSLK